MSWVTAAMRNTTFLCVAIVMNAVVVLLADMGSNQLTLDRWDICELLLVLLVMAYLRVAEHDEFRSLITGLLYGVVFMAVVAHIFTV